MPITYDSVAKRITVTYASGDAKGVSFTTPWGVEDIYQADVSNGWGVVTKAGQQQYSFNCELWISGADTYFWARDCVVEFAMPGDSASRVILQVLTNAHFRSSESTTSHTHRSVVWRVFYGQGGSKYFSLVGEEIQCYNTTFINFPICAFTSATVSSPNAIISKCNFINCSYVLRTGTARAEFTDCTVIGGMFSMTPLEPYAVFERNTIIGALRPFLQNAGMLAGGAYRYCRFVGLKFINCFPHDIDSQVRHNTVNDFIDCQIGKIIQYNTGSALQTGDVWFNWKSTFRTLIVDELGVDADVNVKIYDKDETLVLETSGINTSNEITYYQANATWNGPTGAFARTDVDFRPFKLVISKTGYQDLTIPNIAITEGFETIIRGALVEIPAPLYVQDNQRVSSSVDDLAAASILSENDSRLVDLSALSINSDLGEVGATISIIEEIEVVGEISIIET